MKRLLVVLFFLTAVLSFGQQKFALVIGNGTYTGSGMSKLANPVNDANDVSAALQGLGFTVDKVLDANLDQMESAIMRLKNRLSVSNNAYGFLFYAGHGVQSGGENYLIPVGVNIPSENALRERAISVQWALSELNEAKNALNVVVLDACRDNPFSWKRSGTRGLSVVGNQPADSIIVFATSAGSTAADGTGRNGLFTTHLLNNLKTPGIAVDEVFKRTGSDVARVSNRTQIPAVYNQFFETAYLGNKPEPQVSVTPQPTPAPTVQPAPVTAAVESSSSDSIGIISSVSNWQTNNDNYSRSDVSVKKEIINGREKDVLTISINLAGGTPRWAGAMLHDENIIQPLRRANGVHFEVLGDGKRWKISFATRGITDGAHYETIITTQNGKIINIDVPFNKLKQPEWGSKKQFYKNDIYGIQIERVSDMGGTGASTIKVFDLEIF
jgi:hypothetical protein